MPVPCSSLVIMAVMDVGIMRMGVFEEHVTSRMRVRLLDLAVENVLMLVMAIVAVFVHTWSIGACACSCSWVSVKCSQMPPPMSAAAAQNQGPGASPSITSEIATPTNGAAEKYAPMRAVPRWRNASTNISRLRP